MTLSVTPATFASWTLDAQLGFLEASLASGGDGRELIQLCASVRDHAPLAWLCQGLLERSWFQDPDNRRWFARFFVDQPETAVHKVLRAWVTTEESRLTGRRELGETLIAALQTIPVERLSSMCLIDRFLKLNFPDQHDRHAGDLIQQCAAALRAGEVEAVSLDLLAQVPAQAMDELGAVAATAGPAVAAAFTEQRQGLARRVVEILGRAPKAVSQSNAEELLSRRVYTDPGHFLIELLQNAEDAGASTWRLELEPRRIVVWHDGADFDARDVVGVCSIGQTTKRKQQIGFFGVGFKAVYEVTDRPQLYSADYRFEITDVSVPKPLAERPGDLPRDGTVLVLPLRAPKDPARSPEALFDKARALDPVVLFTLRQIQVIELKLRRDDGTTERSVIQEELDPSGRRALIRGQPGGWVRAYLIQDDEHRWDRGLRPPDRPDRTRVMVGVRLDRRGVPRPLADEAATVYSYLPTDERSGLRFFVQGHFDVPLDRERIDGDSSWNRWVLSKVPAGLARLSSRLLAVGDPELRRELAAGLLEVLPLRGELASPSFRQLAGGLSGALRDLPLLPGTDGELHRPRETVIAPETMARLFDGEPLVDPRTGAAGAFLSPELDGRAAEVARSLGCASLDGDALVGMLELWLGDVAEGERPAREGAPRFLSEPRPEGMAVLADLLLHEVEERERSGRRGPALELLGRLRSLPLVLGAGGGLHRPDPLGAGGIARGDEAVRAIFAGFRPFVHPELDPGPGRGEEKGEGAEDQGGVTRVAVFLERLGVPRLGLGEVVGALEQHLAGIEPPLSGPEAVAFPGSAARLDRILSLVAEGPSGYQARVARLPLFPSTDGRLFPLARSQRDRGGLLAVRPGSLAEELRELYGSRRPLAGPGASRGPVAELMARLDVPALGLETLIADLKDEEGPLARDLAGLRRLHRSLEAVRGDIPARYRGELARLPVWPDEAGRGRPLKGRDAVHIPASDEVRGFFPDAPFLDREVRDRSHLTDMETDSVGVAAVIDALAPEAAPPLRIEPEPEVVARVIAFLTDNAGRIGARSRERLAQLPAFLSDRGEVSRPVLLSLAEDPELRALYGEFPGRRFIDPDGASMALIRRLELESRLIEASAATLVGDLEALSSAGELEGRSPGREALALAGDARHLEQIHRYLAGRAPSLARTVLHQALGLAIYPDHFGKLGRLGDPAAPPPGGPPPVWAAEEGLRELLAAAGARLLQAGAQARLRPLLEAARAPVAGIEALLEHHPVVSDEDLRARLYRWLVSHQDEVFASPRCRELLARVPLFLTERGSLLPAGDLVIDPDLPDLGIDWRPHREIPDELLELLSRHLDLGAPRIEELAQRHLLPAYREAVGNRQRGRAGQLLTYLARRLEGRSEAEVRRVLEPEGEPILLEDQAGTFRPAPELLLPALEIASVVEAAFGAAYPRPSAERYPARLGAFLRKAGVAGEPSLEAVARVMDAPAAADPPGGLALATLVGHLFRREPDRVLGELPLARAAWVLDGAGTRRCPSELYLPDSDVRTLVGDFDDAFVDERIPPLLGDGLCRHLGFRTGRDVTDVEVIRHIMASAEAGTGVSFWVYRWLEAGLVEGWLDQEVLAQRVGDRPWIYTDDGEYRPHREVLGVAALTFFRERRGYWERGAERCPTLCRAFGIPDRVTPEVIFGFLGEVADDVRAEDDRALLDREPALTRMLLSCFERLGRQERAIDPSLPVIPCNLRGQARDEGGPGPREARLVSAREPRLLRSDTPTLEHLFEGAGAFYLANLGSFEQRAEVDRFYELMGVRRLREAYTVAMGREGRDVSPAHPAALGRLRGAARALLGVIPRLRRHLGLLSPEGWVADERLRPLVEEGRFRAIEDLRVVYRLEGVGEVAAEMRAVYDPGEAELLVGSALLRDPAANALDLALGLLPCIYDGPGEDLLVSDIQILLGLGTRERMDRHLDQRHYPEGDGEPPSGASRLIERLDELADYGLDRRLAERYGELAGRDLKRWRDRTLAAKLVPDGVPGEGEPYQEAVRRAVPALLEAVEVPRPSAELVEALERILSAPSLTEIPAGLFTVRPESEDDRRPPEPRRVAPPSGAPESALEPTWDPSAADDWSSFSFDELIHQLERDLPSHAGEANHGDALPGPLSTPLRPEERRGAARLEGRDPARALPSLRRSSAQASPLPPAGHDHPGATPPGVSLEAAWDEGDEALRAGLDEVVGPSPHSEAAGPPVPPELPLGPKRSGIWDRFTRLLGLSGDEPPEGAPESATLPRWAEPQANNFGPGREIGPQLWTTPANIRWMMSQPPAAQLGFAPSALPSPYRYAVRVRGEVFDRERQSWVPLRRALRPAPPGARPLGRTVVFQGKLVPGVSQLPVPLFSKVYDLPEVLHGEPAALDLLGARVGDETLRVRVRGQRPVVIRYEVGLLRAPVLTRSSPAREVAPELTRATLARSELPSGVRRWLSRQEVLLRSPWERAVAVQEFVQSRYVYDETFLERPAVRRELGRLVPGRGNHHLRLLHAAGSGDVLGRGLCYELNLLVVELLRHLGVPALVATGWALEQGVADRPDHLFALALFGSSEGDCLVPLDASMGPQGPRHPLGSYHPGAGGRAAWGLNPRPGIPPIPGIWNDREVFNAPDEETRDQRLQALRQAELNRLASERDLLARLIALVSRIEERPAPPELTGGPPDGEVPDLEDSVAKLRRAASEMLGDDGLVESMLAVMRGEYAEGVSRLTAPLMELIRRGLVRVRQSPTHQLWPSDQRGPWR